MKFLLDTANIADIESLMHSGIISGITTNPSAITRAHSGTPFSLTAYYSQLSKTIFGMPLHIEILATDATDIILEAKNRMLLGDNIVLKIPCTHNGIVAINHLSKLGIRVNCTLIFTLSQAVSAMLAGASYISLCTEKLDDAGLDGFALVRDAVAARDKYLYRCEILCTSIRSLNHIDECIRNGADIAACTPSYFTQLLNHPLTNSELESFLEDYNKTI